MTEADVTHQPGGREGPGRDKPAQDQVPSLSPTGITPGDRAWKQRLSNQSNSSKITHGVTTGPDGQVGQDDTCPRAARAFPRFKASELAAPGIWNVAWTHQPHKENVLQI